MPGVLPIQSQLRRSLRIRRTNQIVIHREARTKNASITTNRLKIGLSIEKHRQVPLQATVTNIGQHALGMNGHIVKSRTTPFFSLTMDQIHGEIRDDAGLGRLAKSNPVPCLTLNPGSFRPDTSKQR